VLLDSDEQKDTQNSNSRYINTGASPPPLAVVTRAFCFPLLWMAVFLVVSTALHAIHFTLRLIALGSSKKNSYKKKAVKGGSGGHQAKRRKEEKT
jgi:hypothetical protein